MLGSTLLQSSGKCSVGAHGPSLSPAMKFAREVQSARQEKSFDGTLPSQTHLPCFGQVLSVYLRDVSHFVYLQGYMAWHSSSVSQYASGSHQLGSSCFSGL